MTTSKEFYMQKLKEAEQSAFSATEPAERERWSKIVETYRQLAGMPEDGSSKSSSRRSR